MDEKDTTKGLRKTIDIMQTGAMILVMLVLLFLLANQVQEYMHGAELLSSPCDICLELNPHIESCVYPTNNIDADKLNLDPSYKIEP